MHACEQTSISRRRLWRPALCVLAGACLLGPLAGHAAGKYDFGTPATPEQVVSWDINVMADGTNLPAGSGSLELGRKVYDTHCLVCHGAKGEGGLGDRLVGGADTLASGKPVKTVGSYWPYAPTLFDYIRRTMPLTAPQSLSNEEVYAVTGYVLLMNGLVKEDDVIDAGLLSGLQMPNRDGFVPDPRPDVGKP